MSNSEIVAENYRRTYWRSRRGMLELDNILLPFVKNKFSNLSQQDQQVYIELLECEDTQLYDWLLHKMTPDNPDFSHIINLIMLDE